MATISVDKVCSLVSEHVDIALANLPRESPVTVRLHIRESYGTFSALGHYLSDGEGHLNLSTAQSTGGTYTGVDATGLFWSLQQDPNQKPGLRLLRREASIPLKYQLTAYPGHVTFEQLPDQSEQRALCTASLEKTYLHESVERIQIKFGRLRGSLFKPRSQAACPPIIDLFGTGGGLMEHRAALLAKEGFSVLALAFFNYDDLPKDLLQLDMDYFEEAVDFMLASQYSREPEGNGGVGIIGVSTGADIAANAAILFGDKVRAVAWINGNFCRNFFPLVYRGRHLPHVIDMDFSLVQPLPRSGGLNLREASCPGCTAEQELPVELATSRFLLLSSLDDFSVRPEGGARLAQRLRCAGRGEFVDHVTYPEAGHLLEPPISPCTSLCYHGVFGMFMDYGGKPRQHHLAQVDSWARITKLFKTAFAHSADGSATKAKL